MAPKQTRREPAFPETSSRTDEELHLEAIERMRAGHFCTCDEYSDTDAPFGEPTMMTELRSDCVYWAYESHAGEALVDDSPITPAACRGLATLDAPGRRGTTSDPSDLSPRVTRPARRVGPAPRHVWGACESNQHLAIPPAEG